MAEIQTSTTTDSVEALAMSGGFSDPVRQSQKAFRAAMDALARPGTVLALEPACAPPEPLLPPAGALALMLCDADTAVWLDRTLTAAEPVARWLRYQTGARLVDLPADADFAFIADPAKLPNLEGFSQGTQEYPDRSTTLIVQVESLARGERFTLAGPGIEQTATLRVKGLSDLFVKQWLVNGARFPRGVDLLFAAPDAIAGLPRTTRITAPEA